VYQRSSATFVSGCVSQKLTSVFWALTLMAQYSAFPIWEQAALVERVLVERRAMQSNGIAADHLGHL
jgi:hypothetical protein